MIIDYNYGADADGNRGITSYELEDIDTPDVVDQIQDYIDATGELPTNSMSVYLFTPTGIEVEFDINPYDYMCEDEMQEYLDGLK